MPTRSKYATLLILALALTGCAERMPNADIIRESQACRDAGLRPNLIRDGWTYVPIYVECVP